MKKILFAAVALVAMASCATEDVVSLPDNNVAIEFDNAFVDNSTRVATDLTLTNLKDFGVYGTVAKGGSQALIFNNTKVSNDSGTFTYSPAQYWVEAANYTFSAFAPFTGAKWGYAPANSDAHNGTLSFNNAEALGEQDLIFASTARTTDDELTAAPAKVNFTFGHLLSKVAFKYTNSFTDGNITLNVYDVKINNAAATGTVALTNGAIGAWAGAGDYARSFGLATAAAENLLANGGGTFTTEHFYLIPVEREYNITFKVDLIQSGVLLKTYEHTVTTTINLEKGKSYSINAALTPENVNPDPTQQLYPIEFDVIAVEDWVNADVAMEAKTVATAQQLVDAIAEGGDIRLTQDITVDTSVVAQKDVNIDLNGKTMTAAVLDPIKNYGKMTISNGKIVAGNAEATRRCIYNYGEMTINGVEFVQTYDKKGAAINNEGKMTINDAKVDAAFYAVWTSGANVETIINGGTYTTTNNVSIRDTWAYAVAVRNGAKLTVNGGTFVGNHGAIAAEGGAEATLNAGTFHCTAAYTGNSDWTLYTDNDSSIIYDAAKCVVTSENPNGSTYGKVTTK